MLFVGDGPEKEGIIREARQLGIAEKTVITGIRRDVERMYAAMDIFVLPSTCDEAFGMVIIEAIIDKQGNVTDARVLRGLPMGISEAAAAAIQRWKYKPAMLNGRPVSVYLTVTVTFTLQ